MEIRDCIGGCKDPYKNNKIVLLLLYINTLIPYLILIEKKKSYLFLGSKHYALLAMSPVLSYNKLKDGFRKEDGFKGVISVLNKLWKSEIG